MRYRIGIDVGGTFIDLLLIDTKTQSMVSNKVMTESDVVECIMDGLKSLAEKMGFSLKQMLEVTELIFHGTTTTTNVILTRKGAKTALITTEGFRDYIDMQKGVKRLEYLFDLRKNKEKPLVPRYLVFPLDERIGASGEIISNVKMEDLERIENIITNYGVQSAAICLLNSYVNPVHEIAVEEFFSDRLPDLFVTSSYRIYPEAGLYERINTSVLNAYAGPAVVIYLTALVEKLQEYNFRGKFLVVQADGSLSDPSIVMKSPIRTIQSGPAAGVMATRYIHEIYGIGNLIFADMGGTSFDVSFLIEGRPLFSPIKEIMDFYVRIPSIDMISIGAGGGSIAWIDEENSLKVGPDSAGSNPGPVCYGRGGEEPTVTDANLLLGYINPDFFYGGNYRLETELAVNVMRTKIGEPLGIDEVEASCGIFELINSCMADTIRMEALERGNDPSDFALVVSGGAGPIHAPYIAEQLNIPLVIIPSQSSVFSAKGMLMSDVEHEFVKSVLITVSGIEDKDIKKMAEKISFYFWHMTVEGATTLEKEGFSNDQIRFRYFMDVRYPGQLGKLTVGVERGNIAGDELRGIIEMFHEKHRKVFGFSLEESDIEIVNLRVRASGVIEKPIFREVKFSINTENPVLAIKGQRDVFIPEKGDYEDVLVFDSLRLKAGNRIFGPSVIEHPYTTIFLSRGSQAIVDEYHNLLILNKKEKLDSVLENLGGMIYG